MDLFRYGGAATKVTTTRSVAHVPHDRSARLTMKERLLYLPTVFTGEQVVAIAAGFMRAAREGGYRIHAGAILPEHCHLIVARHARPVGQIAGHLKGHATRELRGRKLWTDDPAHSPWGRKYWAVFVDEREWVEAAIRYVEKNPMKEGKRAQRWSFVTPYAPPL